MKTKEQQIMMALKTFFREDSGYVVNGDFRVNALLLILNDVMLVLKEYFEIEVTPCKMIGKTDKTP